MKLSLFGRTCLVIFLVTLAAIFLVYFIIRPGYESSVLSERIAGIQKLQRASLANLDQTISDWSHVSQYIAARVRENPKEGESIFHSMMSLYPEIIQMKIHSTGLADELTSQSTLYPSFPLDVKDHQWVHSKIDTALRFAWVYRKDSTVHFFATQTQFSVEQIPFVLTVLWDAHRLNTAVQNFPFDTNYAVHMYSPAGIILQNPSAHSLDQTYNIADTLYAVNCVQKETVSWYVFTQTFRSAFFWNSVMIPEKNLTQPVEDFLIYSFSLILGLMVLMTCLGWVLQRQMKKFIEKMKVFLTDGGQ